MKPERDRRVVESHAIARAAFRAGGLFALLAAMWALVVLLWGGSWWGPLHTFLAGTVVLAISGASQMFTITWAASPPPSPVLAATQRWSVSGGTGLVLAGVTTGSAPLVWTGATGVVAGLVLLGWSIRGSVRRSLLRRFDLSSRFYLTALASGTVGVTLGALLATGVASSGRVRLVHSHLNLVGLVGFTIIGTLPTFLATVAHHRAVSGVEAVVAWWACVGGGAAIVAGLWWGRLPVGIGTWLTAAAAGAVLVGIVARLQVEGRTRLPFLQITAGMTWLMGWMLLDGALLLTGQDPAPFGALTAAAVVAGVGQVLAGSLAYLLPVLAGPPLGESAARMTERRWVPLSTANLAGVAVMAGNGPLAIGLMAVWVIDFGRRLPGLIRRR
jgi:nitrite reductase (NO-forming)